MTPDLNVLANLGIMVLSGIFMGRLMKHLRLPNVTGYLIAGLLLGPYFLPALGIPFSVLSESFINNMTIIPEAALGFIAFSIGNEFKRSYFRQVGTAPVIIACLESLFAVVFVAGMMILTGYSVPFSLVLGSIAAATAPASTIMVINQYRARGPVTKTLLSVVALDDAIALVLFSVCMAAAQSIKGGAANLAWAIFRPVLEIFGALALGILLGILMLIPMRRFHKHGNRLALVCGFLFLGIGLADRFGLSSLMLCMGMGAAVANLSREANSILDVAESIMVRLLAWRQDRTCGQKCQSLSGTLSSAAGRCGDRTDTGGGECCSKVRGADPRGCACRDAGL